MKITFICPPINLSGGIRVVAIHAKQLQERGHEVSVITVKAKGPTLGRQIKSLLQGQGWIPDPQPEPSHFDNSPVLVRVVNHPGPITDKDVPDGDVVIATWWGTAPWVAQLSTRKGAKVYFVQHHEIHPYFPVEEVKSTYTLPLHKIVVARWLETVMAECYGDTQVTLVPNSVDTTLFFAPSRSRQPIPTIGFVYSNAVWKGIDICIQAYVIAQRTLPDLQGLAFGNIPLDPELPLPEGIRYHQSPTQSELRHLYAACDVWLFGSRCEGFGLPILEAMACRTPVIGTSAGAAPDLLTPDVGRLVPLEDVEGMAAAIVEICQLSDSEWQTLSQAAYVKATSYTWEAATDLFEAGLKRAIAASTNPKAEEG